jgi:excisionase family DNA binding protein
MDTFASLDPLLDAKAVGRILGVHPETVLRLARAGNLQGLRFARHWRFRKADIAAWLETRIAPPPSSPLERRS